MRKQYTGDEIPPKSGLLLKSLDTNCKPMNDSNSETTNTEYDVAIYDYYIHGAYLLMTTFSPKSGYRFPKMGWRSKNNHKRRSKEKILMKNVEFAICNNDRLEELVSIVHRLDTKYISVFVERRQPFFQTVPR